MTYRVVTINVSRIWIEWAEWAALSCTANSPFPVHVYRHHPVYNCSTGQEKSIWPQRHYEIIFRTLWLWWHYILPIIWLSNDYCFHNWLRSYHTTLSRREGTRGRRGEKKKAIANIGMSSIISFADLLILFRISYHSHGHLHHNIVWEKSYERNSVSVN